MENRKKGILLMVISALAFSLGGLLVKLIPWSSMSIAGGRCIFSSTFLALSFIVLKRKLVINKTTIIGAVLVSLNMITYILSNKMTTAANAIILEYTAPIYIILIDFIFRHKKPSKLQVITVASVLIGIVFVMASSIDAGSMSGNLIAVFNGFLYATVIMLNSFDGGDSMSSVLLGHILTCVVGLFFVFQESNFSSEVLLYVALLGIFQSGIGYLMFSLGTSMCEPLTASLICYIEPILNPILVLIFYHERFSMLSLVGIAIVLTTIIIYNIKEES